MRRRPPATGEAPRCSTHLRQLPWCFHGKIRVYEYVYECDRNPRVKCLFSYSYTYSYTQFQQQRHGKTVEGRASLAHDRPAW